MSSHDRLHAFDAVRAFALLLGVLFHAGFSFLPGMPPGLWAIVDRSPSTTLSVALFTSHIFRMSLFFVVAGFFARLLFHRRGARGFWSNRSKRILVPFIAGWLVLFPSIAAVWLWGLTKTFGTLPEAPPNMPPPSPGAFPLTHLWFLYYLLVLYAIVVLCRSALATIDRHGSFRRAVDAALLGLVRSGAAALVLPLPLSLALFVRPDWVGWFGIPTPDHSLIPEFASLVGFGTAVVIGWLAHRQVELLDHWRRQWPIHFAGASVATIVCLAIAGLTPALTPMAPGVKKLTYAVAYGTAIWCWSFAILGLAMQYLSRERPVVRYVADASYWIYLVHLPIVAAFQIAVGHQPWHWSIKFPLILVGSLAVLFVSYRYLVRGTFIGQLLNGRRYPRRRIATDADGNDGATGAEAMPSAGDAARIQATRDPNDLERFSIATLEGVHKTYGKTLALNGLDIAVGRGELLAVLGPNGAGKSTAISLWLGLLEPDRGAVGLLGGSPSDVAGRRHIGVMMQEVGLTPELRVRELIELTASYYPEPLPTEQTLALTRLDALASRPYAKLSAGQKRQVQFALAICGRPQLLFLDEPTVGLDIDARATMWRTIRHMVAQGCSIILTTHYLEEAEALADRVVVLANGRVIASGSVDDIRSLVSRKHITCSSMLAVDDVMGWPGVMAACRETNRLQIIAADAESIVRRLLAADDRLGDLEVRQAGLAEAFRELTKEAA